MDRYTDRRHAGRILADLLTGYAEKPGVIILGLARGGLPVAAEIAKSLKVPLDVFIVRKLGVPGHEELAMGAMADDMILFNDEIIREMDIPQKEIGQVIQAEKNELKRRETVYRGNRPYPDLTDKTVILVDDGIATGATMRAAIMALRQKKPAAIIVAAPVAAADTCEQVANLADKLVCPLRPELFYAVGAWYENFGQTTDEEVRQLLQH